jgi:hypothetical protein
MEERFQRLLEAQKVAEASGNRGIEFDDDIYVAPAGIEIVAKNRPKHFEPADAMKIAQPGDTFAIFIDQWVHRTSILTPSLCDYERGVAEHR